MAAVELEVGYAAIKSGEIVFWGFDVGLIMIRIVVVVGRWRW